MRREQRLRRRRKQRERRLQARLERLPVVTNTNGGSGAAAEAEGTAELARACGLRLLWLLLQSERGGSSSFALSPEGNPDTPRRRLQDSVELCAVCIPAINQSINQSSSWWLTPL